MARCRRPNPLLHSYGNHSGDCSYSTDVSFGENAILKIIRSVLLDF